MDFDLGSRNKNFLAEQRLRKEQAKKKLAEDHRIRETVKKQQEEMEIRLRENRVQWMKKKEEEEERRLEQERKTGGIEYESILKAYPTCNDGDRIILPPSALEKLNPQDALERGALTFELTTEDGTSNTCAGVLEFVAEEDELGIPPKVARSLAGPECRDLAKIKVQYARLDRGIFARLQPCGDGFGDRHLDLKEILERSLRTHVTLSEGDIVLVRQGGRTFNVLVRELRPEPQVLILNTDLEVDMLPSEAQERALDEQKRAEIVVSEAAETQRRLEKEKEETRLELLRSLPEEPQKADPEAVTCLFRLPGGKKVSRLFLKSNLMKALFDLVRANTDLEEGTFLLVTNYPRKKFQVTEHGLQSLFSLAFDSKQETFFVEQVDHAEQLKTESSSKLVANATAMFSPQSVTHNYSEVVQQQDRVSTIWTEALAHWENTFDAQLLDDQRVPIHAMEPILPPSTSGGKWEAQLEELTSMGFVNKTLNLELLDRYQGRLIRVINYLSEM